MPNAIPIRAAAEVLGYPPSAARRWLRNGCPIVSAGRRGPGGQPTVDVDAVRSWLDATPAEKQLHALAVELPDIVVAALADVARGLADLPHKRDTINALVVAAVHLQIALTDRLRFDVPSIPKALPTDAYLVRAHSKFNEACSLVDDFDTE